jgi:hypothetical protein
MCKMHLGGMGVREYPCHRPEQLSAIFRPGCGAKSGGVDLPFHQPEHPIKELSDPKTANSAYSTQI